MKRKTPTKKVKEYCGQRLTYPKPHQPVCSVHGEVNVIVDYRYCGVPIPDPSKPIKTTLQEHKRMVVTHIVEVLKIKVSTFCRVNSKNIGKGYTEQTLRTYLADGDKNNSIKAINDCCTFLNLPTLRRETKVTRTNLYFIDK